MAYMTPQKTTDPSVVALCKKAFPAYNGRKFRWSTSIPTSLDSYWEGGSRDSYAFVNLKTKEVAAVQSNHPFFEKDKPRFLSALPLGFGIVQHSIFCGKDMGMTLYINAQDIWPALPAPTP